MVAVCLVTDEGEGVAEVKSLAVDPACQEGLREALLDFAATRYAGVCRPSGGHGRHRSRCPHERCGFARHHVAKSFFADNYDHPIWEGGVLLQDMVYLRKAL